MKCPKCQAENPETKQFCGDCGTQLPPPKDYIPVVTETLQTPVHELTTGTTFAGRYQVIEELGRGGMGKVYRVLDKKLNEEVAIKLIKPEIASDKKTLERFSNELKIARKIVNKNVGRMYHLSEEQGTYYITMEYVPGENLKSSIRRFGPLPIGKTVFLAEQICEGLAEAHRLGIVHRDLKPGNIMIDEEGNARIMDFGIARLLKERGITGEGMIIGTPEYMSPEQVEGKDVDHRSDIYSLGVILYEMVTGRVPFEGDTPFTIGVKHKSEVPKDPKELNSLVPGDLSRLILRCLEKDKAKRYESTKKLHSELEKIAKGIPTEEKIPPAKKTSTSREITVKFSLKKAVVIPVLAFLGLMLIAFVLWQAIPRSGGVRQSIAVITFKNQTGDKAFDYLQEAIPNLLITSLEQSKHFRVTTWERLKDFLSELGQERAAVIDEELGFELCRRKGIDTIVVGTYTKAGNMFATDAKVWDVGDRQILKTASARGEGVDSILKNQIDELSHTISRGRGFEALRIEKALPKITDMTTNSLEAYNYFLRGRDDYDKLYYSDAKKFLQKAVDLDPTFAAAYLWLGKACGDLLEGNAQVEAYKKAKEYSVNTTEKERLYIEAGYASVVEKDADKRIEVLREIAQKYPEEKQVHYDLGVHYQDRSMYPEAIEEFQKALAIDSNYGAAMNNLAYVYVDSREFEKAIEYFQKYTAVSPGDANPFDSIAELNLRMGNLDEALRKYKEALEIKPDFYLSCLSIAYIYALMENYSEAMRWVDEVPARASSDGAKLDQHAVKAFFYYWLGNKDQALAELKIHAVLAASLGSPGPQALNAWLRGWVYFDCGQFDQGEKAYQNFLDLVEKSAFSLLREERIYFALDHLLYLGFLDLKRGKIESAKAKLTQYSLPPGSGTSSLLRGWVVQTFECLQGEIYLTEGKPEKAVEILVKSVGFNIPTTRDLTDYFAYNLPVEKDTLARAYKAMGETDKAIAEYGRLMTIDPANQVRQLIPPIYHYRLARLYEDKGLADEARKQYQKFLEVWKDADPGRPEVADAKKRLSALGT